MQRKEEACSYAELEVIPKAGHEVGKPQHTKTMNGKEGGGRNEGA